MKILIDKEKCICCSVCCCSHAVFDTNGIHAVVEDPLPELTMEDLREIETAVEACPVNAITLEEFPDMRALKDVPKCLCAQIGSKYSYRLFQEGLLKARNYLHRTAIIDSIADNENRVKEYKQKLKYAEEELLVCKEDLKIYDALEAKIKELGKKSND